MKHYMIDKKKTGAYIFQFCFCFIMIFETTYAAKTTLLAIDLIFLSFVYIMYFVIYVIINHLLFARIIPHKALLIFESFLLLSCTTCWIAMLTA